MIDERQEKTSQGIWRRFFKERNILPVLECVHALFDDEPSSLMGAWARTTAGAVVVLLAVQIITGTLIAFYYVPSVDVAHATVVYIEKALPAGSWLRAVHHYGSQWLTIFLVLHLAQMFWRTGYGTRPVAWLAAVLLLLFVLAGGVTGYSLPWDARAYFGTGVTAGITGGLPLVGDALSRWLVGGTDISTITLSRFFAFHVLVIPAAVILTIVSRVFIFRDTEPQTVEDEQVCLAWQRRQLLRQSISAGLVFIALALYPSNIPCAAWARSKRSRARLYATPGRSISLALSDPEISSRRNCFDRRRCYSQTYFHWAYFASLS